MIWCECTWNCILEQLTWNVIVNFWCLLERRLLPLKKQNHSKSTHKVPGSTEKQSPGCPFCRHANSNFIGSCPNPNLNISRSNVLLHKEQTKLNPINIFFCRVSPYVLRPQSECQYHKITLILIMKQRLFGEKPGNCVRMLPSVANQAKEIWKSSLTKYTKLQRQLIDHAIKNREEPVSRYVDCTTQHA